jgi:hypothetical protein
MSQYRSENSSPLIAFAKLFCCPRIGCRFIPGAKRKMTIFVHAKEEGSARMSLINGFGSVRTEKDNSMRVKQGWLE